MRNLVSICCVSVMLSSFFTLSAQAGDEQRYRSANFLIGETVAETVTQLQDFLQQQGFEISLTVDHASSAAAVGLELAPTQVIFARLPRRIERRLLQRSPTIGIDLPLKFLVYENDGEVLINVNAMGYLIDRHDIQQADQLLRSIDRSIKRVADAPEGLITVQSQQDFYNTVETIRNIFLGIPAFNIPIIIDYSLNEKRKGRDDDNRKQRGPVLITFANPNAGTPLMQANQRIGIDLPQKFLVWQDREGNVNITYNDPIFLGERHDVQGIDNRLQGVANALENFALIGAGLR